MEENINLSKIKTMNSPRSMESLKNNNRSEIIKGETKKEDKIINRDEIIKNQPENRDEKIKSLLEQNEKLEKECLKFKIQLKTMENKIQDAFSKSYKSNTNTSSKFILPSEFKHIWELIAQEHIINTFIDFFDNQRLAYYIVTEFFYLNLQLFKESFLKKIQNILSQLKIQITISNISDILKFFRPLIEEFYDSILYDQDEINLYSNEIKEKLINNLTENKIISNEDYNYGELIDILESKYFVDFINILKKLNLYCIMNEPPLEINLPSFEKRSPTIRNYKSNEVICIDGIINDNKSCLVILEPPYLRKDYYLGLKPIVIEYKKGNFKEYEEIHDHQKDIISIGKKEIIKNQETFTKSLEEEIKSEINEINRSRIMKNKKKENVENVFEDTFHNKNNETSDEKEKTTHKQQLSKNNIHQYCKLNMIEINNISIQNEKETSKTDFQKLKIKSEINYSTPIFKQTEEEADNFIEKKLTQIDLNKRSFKEKLFEKFVESSNKETSRNKPKTEKYGTYYNSLSNLSLQLTYNSYNTINQTNQTKINKIKSNKLISSSVSHLMIDNYENKLEKLSINSEINNTNIKKITNKSNNLKLNDNNNNIQNTFNYNVSFNNITNITNITNNNDKELYNNTSFKPFSTNQISSTTNKKSRQKAYFPSYIINTLKESKTKIINSNNQQFNSVYNNDNLNLNQIVYSEENLKEKDLNNFNKQNLQKTIESKITAKNIKLQQGIEIKKSLSNNSTPNTTIIPSSNNSNSINQIQMSTKQIMIKLKESSKNFQSKNKPILIKHISKSNENNHSLNKTHSYKNNNSNSTGSQILNEKEEKKIRQQSIDNSNIIGFLNCTSEINPNFEQNLESNINFNLLNSFNYKNKDSSKSNSSPKLNFINKCKDFSINKEKMKSKVDSTNKDKVDFRSISHHNLLQNQNQNEKKTLNTKSNISYEDSNKSNKSYKKQMSFINQIKSKKKFENIINTGREKIGKVNIETAGNIINIDKYSNKYFSKIDNSKFILKTDVIERKKSLNINSNSIEEKEIKESLMSNKSSNIQEEFNKIDCETINLNNQDVIDSHNYVYIFKNDSERKTNHYKKKSESSVKNINFNKEKDGSSQSTILSSNININNNLNKITNDKNVNVKLIITGINNNQKDKDKDKKLENQQSPLNINSYSNKYTNIHSNNLNLNLNQTRKTSSSKPKKEVSNSKQKSKIFKNTTSNTNNNYYNIYYENFKIKPTNIIHSIKNKNKYSQKEKEKEKEKGNESFGNTKLKGEEEVRVSSREENNSNHNTIEYDKNNSRETVLNKEKYSEEYIKTEKENKVKSDKQLIISNINKDIHKDEEYYSRERYSNHNIHIKRYPSYSRDLSYNKNKNNLNKFSFQDYKNVCSSVSKERKSPILNSNSIHIKNNKLSESKISPKNTYNFPNKFLNSATFHENNEYKDKTLCGSYIQNLHSNMNVNIRKSSFNSSNLAVPIQQNNKSNFNTGKIKQQNNNCITPTTMNNKFNKHQIHSNKGLFSNFSNSNTLNNKNINFLNKTDSKGRLSPNLIVKK